MKHDFSGYATKAGLRCTDGRTILAHAFKDQDGAKVPLVWQHQHTSPGNVLGHAILEDRKDGVYVYGFFNNSTAGKEAKEAVEHKDVEALSIYANEITFKNKTFVEHGKIREVSLVFAGANPGAFISDISFSHDDEEYDSNEVIIFSGDNIIRHADEGEKETPPPPEESQEKEDEDMTVAEVYENMTEEQKNVVAFFVAAALEKSEEEESTEETETDSTKEDSSDETAQHSDNNEEGSIMHRNIFENKDDGTPSETITHSQLNTIVQDALNTTGSLKKSFIQHAGEYGIGNIDLLFPDAKTIDNLPEFVSRRTEWVSHVLGATKHVPFGKIRTLSADITHDEARAKGYIKGSLKKEEFFELKARTTSQTTVYKKQKLDRDDAIDITDIDVIAWLKAEMRLMLEEEIARAILFGDGREADDPDKIKDPRDAVDGVGIRSIVNDHEFYSHKLTIPANSSGEARIEAVLRAMNTYRGSGSPNYYTTRNELTDLLLLKDRMGRRLYETEAALASAMGIGKIVPIDLDAPEGVIGIIVNLKDYAVGSTNGGKTAFFDDFDIDYNQMKYLYEARLSGALIKWKSAIVVRRDAGTQVVPTAPSFDSDTNTITIPTVTGVVYKVNDVVQTGDVVIDQDSIVEASPDSGYYFRSNSDTLWEFTYNEGV